MKKLLVLTDFSKNSEHAENAALKLSVKMKYDILLWYSLPYTALVVSDTAGPYVTETTRLLFEESRRSLRHKAYEMKQMASKTANCKTRIHYRCSDGNLGEIIGTLSAEKGIEMIVMGGRAGGAVDHWLSGSDTSAVIRKACKPVWIIPEAVTWQTPRKIVFATDFSLADPPAVDYLVELSKALSFRLDIVHVIHDGEAVTEIEPELAFHKYLAKRNMDCTRIARDGVAGSLEQY